MTVKEHSTLTGTSLHEPKGVAAASANTSYIANGSGSGSWTTVPVAGLASAAKAFQAQLLHVRDEKSSNVGGGALSTVGNWFTRDLNTVVTNEISGASLGSNQITLPAGTYYIQARVPAWSVLILKSRLYNVTDSSAVIYGNSSYAYSQMDTFTTGRFTIAGTKVLALQMYSPGDGTSSGNHLGYPTGIISLNEVFSEAFIWKVA